jgi:hypothetical protein
MMHRRRGPSKGRARCDRGGSGDVEDPDLKDTLVIDYSGRITIDAAPPRVLPR